MTIKRLLTIDKSQSLNNKKTTYGKPCSPFFHYIQVRPSIQMKRARDSILSDAFIEQLRQNHIEIQTFPDFALLTFKNGEPHLLLPLTYESTHFFSKMNDNASITTPIKNLIPIFWFHDFLQLLNENKDSFLNVFMTKLKRFFTKEFNSILVIDSPLRFRNLTAWQKWFIDYFIPTLNLLFKIKSSNISETFQELSLKELFLTISPQLEKLPFHYSKSFLIHDKKTTLQFCTQQENLIGNKVCIRLIDATNRTSYYLKI